MKIATGRCALHLCEASRLSVRDADFHFLTSNLTDQHITAETMVAIYETVGAAPLTTATNDPARINKYLNQFLGNTAQISPLHQLPKDCSWMPQMLCYIIIGIKKPKAAITTRCPLKAGPLCPNNADRFRYSFITV
jgi:hypothetical protein